MALFSGSGLLKEYPIWSTGFQAFTQTKSLFDTIPPERLDNDPTKEESATHDAAEAAYGRALDDIEKRENTLWCCLAMVLDSTSLIVIRHNSMDNRGLGGGHKAWVFLHQRF